MDHQPPPFFKRGPAPVALLSFYVALSVALLVVDARLQTLEVLRQALSMFTHPVQQLAHLPAQFSITPAIISSAWRVCRMKTRS
jgi:rod shape-determining protein MreC